MNIFTRDFKKLYRVNTTAIFKTALVYDNPHLDPKEFDDETLIEKLKKVSQSQDTVKASMYQVEVEDDMTLMKVNIIETESDYYHILFEKVLILVPKQLPDKLDKIREIIREKNGFDLSGGTLYAFFYCLSQNGLNFSKRSQWNSRYYSIDVSKIRWSLF